MNATRTLVFAFFTILFIPTVCFALILGPYSGTVIDSQTGEPIKGASVLIFWEKLIPTPMEAHSEVFEARLVYTDRKGAYHLPRILPNLGLSAVLESTQILIYQPGYQAYTVRILHHIPYPKPDAAFKEKGNIVKLDRVPPNFNYREHYEKISRVLWGIHEYGWTDPIWGSPITLEKRMELNLKRGIPEKEELLRRARWEARR